MGGDFEADFLNFKGPDFIRPLCGTENKPMHMSDRLSKLARAYHDEAGRCLRGKAYLAACVMQGAALEALLQAMCYLYPEAVKKTVVYQKKQKRGFQRKETGLWSSNTSS
jgi:hypothetical protein